MQLEPKVAQTIVDSLKDIIHHEINLFDTTGTIIASTDAKRVGMFHDGAFKVIKSRAPVIITADMQVHGARAGTNLPVLFNDSVVAVIGITGDPTEVAPLGNIIKKMTEILIRENWIQMTRYTRQANYSSLVSQLISKDRDDSLVDYLMAVLEVDANVHRQVIVGKFLTNGKPLPSYVELIDVATKFMNRNPSSFYAATNTELCLMSGETSYHKLNEMLMAFQSAVQESFDCSIVFGIGRFVHNESDYWLSFQDAKETAEWLLFNKKSTIKRYTDLDMALILTSLPRVSIDDFRKKVISDISPDELSEFKRILAAYVDQNVSIIHGAAELYIHKNTFQNKLNHIHDVTGYNPRKLHDFVVLYLAFAMDDYSKFEDKDTL